jgi:anti-anti-sigma factor
MQIIKEKNNIIIKPDTNIVASMIDDLNKELENLFYSSPDDIVIDFDGVKSIDSIGIHAIIVTHRQLKKKDRKLKIINVNDTIYTLLTIMRLNIHFVIKRVGQVSDI